MERTPGRKPRAPRGAPDGAPGDDCSPIFVPCTQEAYDQLDVAWDWSPPRPAAPRPAPAAASSAAPARRRARAAPPADDAVRGALERLRAELRRGAADDDLTGLDDLFGDDPAAERELVLQAEGALRRARSDGRLAPRTPLGARSASGGDLRRAPRRGADRAAAPVAAVPAIPPPGTSSGSDRIEGAVAAKVPRKAAPDESPIKCSPEEIEQKRLRALAKLEARKSRDAIERNRREALRRLEAGRMRRRRGAAAPPSGP